MLVTINTEDLKGLVMEGSKIIFSAEAEQSLLRLLELKDEIDVAIQEAKDEIERTALEYNPNFTAVYGQNLVVGYRKYGAKYRLDDQYASSLPKNLFKVETKYSPISKEIDNFAKEHNLLPLGISEAQRSKKISIKRKDEFGEDSEE